MFSAKFPDQGKDEMGCLLLPNAVLLIKGAPHPENGKKLRDVINVCYR